MARSFSADSLVVLPRLTALSATRLLAQLLATAAQEPALPPIIAEARNTLVPARERLETMLAKRAASSETPLIRAADMVEDNAFGAFVDWLRAIARLPLDLYPQAEAAQTVLVDVFKDGTGFLKIAPENEWQEAEIRLALLREKDHVDTVLTLGGKPFLDEITRAHKAYGEAVGTTTPKVAPEAPAIRAALDQARQEIRAYVMVVGSRIRREDPESQRMADRLLAPLIHWRRSSSKPAENPADEAPEPAPIPQNG